jgi:hypothetical protein
MNDHSWFANRVGVLATMHQKERAISPLLERELGIKVIVPANFNTDRFGTFTRDVPRPGTQLEAARIKAEGALDLTGETIGIASEGIFSPHPILPHLPVNREIVLLLDRDRDLEIFGQEVSTETNYSHQLVASLEEACDFATKAGFPEHGLVVMVDANTQNPDEIVKGIITEDQLKEAIARLLRQSKTGKVHVETDMRALYNPTRMKAIEKATQNLLEKLNRRCPQCGCPGFDVVEQLQGLRCAACNLPTALIQADVYGCQKCGFRQEVAFPKGIEKADPAQCAYCNP